MKYLTFLMFLLSTCSYAGEKNSREYGKFSPSELGMTYYEKDSTAEAVILYKSCKVSATIINTVPGLIYEYLVRIKVLKNSGLHYADIVIPYVGYSKIEQVMGIKAHTINLEGEKVVESALTREMVFDVDMNHYFHTKKFSLPNVREGSIIEYTYRIESHILFYVKKWEFQSDIPTIYNEYSTYIPDVFQYRTSFKGMNCEYNLETEEGYTDFKMRSYFPDMLDMKINKYSVEHIQGLKVEPYCQNRNAYYSSVTMQLQRFTIPGYKDRSYLYDWDEFGKFLMNADWFGEKIKNYNFLNEIITSSVGDNPNKDLKTINSLYDKIINTINFNEYYSLYIFDLKDVYEKKVGNGTEINTILLCALQKIGFDASPVVSSSRENGQFQKLYPVINDFDHMMVRVKLDSNEIILDATDPLRTPGIIDEEFIGQTGYCIKGKSWKWMEFKVPVTSRNVYNYNLTLDKDGICKGKLQYMSNLYSGLTTKKAIKKDGLTSFTRNLFSSKKSNITIDSSKITSEDISENKIIIESDLSIKCEHEDKIIYIEPFMDKTLHSNPFLSELRLLPVEFKFPINQTSTVNLALPEGYKITEIPKNIRIKLPDDSGSFTFLTSVDNNKITLKSTLSISKIQYPAEQYSEIRDFFSEISKIYAQQIVIEQQ